MIGVVLRNVYIATSVAPHLHPFSFCFCYIVLLFCSFKFILFKTVRKYTVSSQVKSPLNDHEEVQRFKFPIRNSNYRFNLNHIKRILHSYIDSHVVTSAAHLFVYKRYNQSKFTKLIFYCVRITMQFKALVFITK